MNWINDWYAQDTNPANEGGSVGDAHRVADAFIGLSAPHVIGTDDLKKMAADPIAFAMANPTPEIMPEEAEPHVAVMATGRSDYANQINNVLCFPGIFNGALACRAARINEEMKLAAATPSPPSSPTPNSTTNTSFPQSSTSASPPPSPTTSKTPPTPPPSPAATARR